MGSYPVTFGGQTFTSGDFAGHNYVHGFPSLLKAANQAISERVGLTFTVNQDIAPMLGPLVVQAPVGLPIIANTLLSFASPHPPVSQGHFLLRVLHYHSESGTLSGQVVLVEGHRPSNVWTVGMDRMVQVDDIYDGGSGLWALEHMPLARSALSLPGPDRIVMREDFHEGRLPEGWSYEGDPMWSFPLTPQWDGVGTYQSRSFIRLHGGLYSLGLPPLPVWKSMRLHIGVRNGLSVDNAAFDLGGNVWWYLNNGAVEVEFPGLPSSIPLPALGSEWEAWEFLLDTEGPCSVIRDGTVVASAPALSGQPPTYARVIHNSEPERYFDMDYYYRSVTL